MTDTALALDRLTLRRDGRCVLQQISLSIGAGEFVGLIGPNGAGKTTLMRAALGLIAAEGHSSLAALPPARRAAQVAWLPQSREIAWPVAVEHLVSLGQQARGGSGNPAAVAAAMARMGLQAYRHRRATELSGGEQARALIARALAQDTPLLMADEPIAGLDPAQQIRSMQVFRSLADEGRSVLASLHDLGLAARHCTRLVVIAAGRIIADGPPAAVLTADLMAQVFGVSCWRAETAEGLILQPLEAL